MRDGRVLAVEPDDAARGRLDAVLHERLREPVDIVPTADDAIRAIECRVPDLVLTSNLLRPSEVQALTVHLKGRADTSHIPILITPQLGDARQLPSSSTRTLWPASKWRATEDSSGTAAFLRQLDDYLEQARAAQARREATAALPSHDDQRALRLVDAPAAALVLASRTIDVQSRTRDRRRAPRTRRAHLPWLRIGRLPWGSDVEVVDLSRTGVLLETTIRMTPGAIVDLEFLGHGVSTTMESRIVRAEPAHADAPDVRYRNAAAFMGELNLTETGKASESPWFILRTIGDILTRALAAAAKGGSPATIRASFERELQQFLPACTMRIQEAPTPGGRPDEAMFFTIPSVRCPAVLAVTFDGRPPSTFELEALQCSAYLAAALLDVAPLRIENKPRAGG